MKKLLLAGAGHAHIGLLRRLSRKRAEDVAVLKLTPTDITLITEQPQTIYSGMLPGWMAGHYSLNDISIDIKSLCLRAGVRFIQRPIVNVDATSGKVVTSGNKQLGNNDSTDDYSYDVLSLNTGADTDLGWLKTNQNNDFKNNNFKIKDFKIKDFKIKDFKIKDFKIKDFDKNETDNKNGNDNANKGGTDKKSNDEKSTNVKSLILVVPIRPLHHFVQQWQQIIKAAKQTTHYRLAIVGAGAAATELVMAAQFMLQQIHPSHQAYLVCGEHLLSGFSHQFRKRVIKQLKRHNIEIVYARAAGIADGQLLMSCSSSNSSFDNSSKQSSGHPSNQLPQRSLPVDAVIAATGVTGSAWTTHTDIATIDNGFIAVNHVQQSTSHPNVFAVGDVCTRVDREVAHSGVHAVFGGMVEADNLLACLADEPLQSYQPKKRTLYLLSCGDQYAIGSWGKYSLQGRWVWYLKRYIDKRFINAK